MAIAKSLESQLHELTAENAMLRQEIRVAREAAEITAHLVIQEFEQSENLLGRLREASGRLSQANLEMAEANHRLVELDKLKSEFLSSVSHELRTPLTSIRGFVKLVSREFERIFLPLGKDHPEVARKGERIRDNLAIVGQEAERLTRLINDVLDLAKIESGRVEWRDARIPVREVIDQAMQAVAGMFTERPEVQLQTRVAEDTPDLMADRDRMVQVLVNLLNNAAKFTDHGQVRIIAGPGPSNGVRIEVHDSGCGFPLEEAERIFDRFQQAKHGDTLTDKPKGTGLGLAICREVVGHYGGRIWAESTPGVGSVFHIALPGAEPELPEEPPPEITPSDQQKPLVLVVDDAPSVCRYLQELLQENGYRVVIAGNGQEALTMARRHHPDIITMDLAMPVLGGREAILALRRDAELCHIPVIVVSALPDLEAAGANVFLGKPVEEMRLLDSIRVLLQATPTDQSQPLPFRCLILLAQGNRSLPPGLTCAEYCTLEELPERLASGYEGMLLIPTELLHRVDVERLNSQFALQIVVMPPSLSTGDSS